MANYTDADKIAAYLGVTLTADQQTQATAMAAAATAYVDRYTGRSWQSDAVTDEQHDVTSGTVYLGRAVASVSTVKLRTSEVGSDSTTLDADEWELLDADAGIVVVSATSGSVALVSYTPQAAPADVLHAATQIAAAWMGATLRPESAGLESVSVGQSDLSIKFRVDARTVPAEARQILDAHKRIVLA